MEKPTINELVRRKNNQKEYQMIRHEWIVHSKAEDGRDIPGLMSTLTEDCVYELPVTGHRWEGKEGATRFYTEMLAAFPDIHFDLQNIVIGPQGVWEEAIVTGTHLDSWLGMPPTGEKLEWVVQIYFPWDPVAQKFSGERIYSTRDHLTLAHMNKIKENHYE